MTVQTSFDFGITCRVGGTPAAVPSAARVFTIPPHRPFLPTLARALMDGRLTGGKSASPLEMAGATLLLPTRRATRALQDAFLSQGSARAMLLPRIALITDGEGDGALFRHELDAGGTLDRAAHLYAPAISPLERHLLLVQLVQRWSQALRPPRSRDGDLDAYAAAGAQTPAQAAHLARELARLMDVLETHGVALDRLAGLVGEGFSTHWQQTLDFLTIITQWWPQHLRAVDQLSAVARATQLLANYALTLSKQPPSGPIIIAGVTAATPATLALMRIVARAPWGALVLPGLDLDLDEVSWQAITGDATSAGERHEEHPQSGLKALLDGLAITRGDVQPLSNADEPARSAPAMLRTRFASQALRPASTTAQWEGLARQFSPSMLANALADVTLIEAASAPEEAEVAALILREAAETPGRTAALVTPDRVLARRVAIRLQTWGIAVDDSAGRPFAKTVPGTLLDLIVEMVARRYDPVSILALLTHPLVRLGRDTAAIRTAARVIDLAAFRGPYLGDSLADVTAALGSAECAPTSPADSRDLTRRPKAVRRLSTRDWEDAHALVAALVAAMAPLEDLVQSATEHPLETWARAHIAVAQRLCAIPHDATADSAAAPNNVAPAVATAPLDDLDTGCPLWQQAAGEVALAFFSALLTPGLPSSLIAPKDYPDFYRALTADEVVRPTIPTHPRLFIWGPYEARLQSCDITILGSLNDGTWPAIPDPGPWLNRPMRAALGLPSPEAQTGAAAHDFSQLLGGSRVFLTRAHKIDGVPTVPSRWLLRILALTASVGLADDLRRAHPGHDYLAWARLRDTPTSHRPTPAPAPRPALALRPRKLSVSDIETWIANPYAIYAKHILKLEALPPLAALPDAALRGAIIHAALARFTLAHPQTLPPNVADVFMRDAQAVLAAWTRHPRVAAFWIPRLGRFARWFGETEPVRRHVQGRAYAEISGSMIIGALDLPFELTARADRFDVADGTAIITDYKTGTPPKKGEVAANTSPQLPLEAAMAAAGGFGAALAVPIAQLRYILVSGGEPAGCDKIVAGANAPEMAATALAGLERHIARFDDPSTPYPALRRAKFNYRYDAYAHLARVAEWSGAGGDDDGGDDGQTAGGGDG